MLQSRRLVMLELFESFVLVAGHRKMDLAIFVIPVHCNTNVPVSGPVCAAFVMLLDDGFEMERVFFPNVFHAEIIHNQCEGNGTCCVFPEAGDEFGLEITRFVQTLFEEFVGDESSMRQAVHAFVGLKIDGTVCVYDVVEFVFIDNLAWNVANVESNVFR